jgi:hypothetical protein
MNSLGHPISVLAATFFQSSIQSEIVKGFLAGLSGFVANSQITRGPRRVVKLLEVIQGFYHTLV